jgi:hypothetical protein
VLGPVLPGAQVARNVSLSAEALLETYPVADLSRDSDLRRTVAEAAGAANR